MSIAPVLPTLRLTAHGSRLLDALGREVLLRGVNCGGRSKIPPFFPFPFVESGRSDSERAPAFDQAVATYCDRLVDWGLNVVRLPFSWEALEPQRGSHDERWLSRYTDLAAAIGDRGLRVIVDFHQDVFGRPWFGDGFPLWACDRPIIDPPPVSPQWFMGYLNSDDVRRNYDRFWNDDDGIRTAFSSMWRTMAARLWQLDCVIGFEVFNEPGWGNADPTVWAKETLTPFYSELAAAIRQAAPNSLVFFDATGVDAISGEAYMDRPDGDGLVFAPHYYDPAALLEGRWDGGSDIATPIGRWRETGDGWDVPVLLGEFGISPSGEGAADYVRANYSALDQHLLHATLWEYSATVDDWNDEDMSIVDGYGNERPTVAALVRPFPAATPGTLTGFSWDPRRRTGEWRFDAEPGLVGELAVPGRIFPEGVGAGSEGTDVQLMRDDVAHRLICVPQTSGPTTVRFGAAG